VLGSLFILLAASTGLRESSGKWSFVRPLLLGLIAGGMHLARADGIVWLVVALALVAWQAFRQGINQVGWPFYRRILFAGELLLSLLVGYAAVHGRLVCS